MRFRIKLNSINENERNNFKRVLNSYLCREIKNSESRKKKNKGAKST